MPLSKKRDRERKKIERTSKIRLDASIVHRVVQPKPRIIDADGNIIPDYD